jgi:hypothetical protein
MPHEPACAMARHDSPMNAPRPCPARPCRIRVAAKKRFGRAAGRLSQCCDTFGSTAGQPEAPLRGRPLRLRIQYGCGFQRQSRLFAGSNRRSNAQANCAAARQQCFQADTPVPREGRKRLRANSQSALRQGFEPNGTAIAIGGLQRMHGCRDAEECQPAAHGDFEVVAGDCQYDRGGRRRPRGGGRRKKEWGEWFVPRTDHSPPSLIAVGGGTPKAFRSFHVMPCRVRPQTPIHFQAQAGYPLPCVAAGLLSAPIQLACRPFRASMRATRRYAIL